MDESAIEPIDFLKLLREEKKIARVKASLKKKDTEAKDDYKEDDSFVLPTEHPWRWTDVPKFDRQKNCVCSSPSNIFYLQEFLPHDIEKDIWNWLKALPRVGKCATNGTEPAQGCWHALQHSKRNVAVFSTEAFPAPLQIVVDALIQSGVFDKTPNHILVNEYSDDQGIMPHTDGPAYYSRTATISLGEGNVLLNFQKRPNHEMMDDSSANARRPQLLLHGHGSLVVFEDEAYLDYMHSIEDRVSEEVARRDCLNAPEGTIVQRKPRISLTIRCRK